MSFIRPPFVSEREDAHYWPNGAYDGPADEDCVFCSGLMQYLAHKPGAAPATLYEAERIRQAAGLGPSGPANSDALIDGTTKRYGWAPTKIPSGFSVLWSAFAQPGVSATASGKLSNFPTGHRLRRFIPTWTGGHRVYVAKMDDEDRVWWMDPEGPKTGYSGEWVTKAELQTFVNGGLSHTLATVATEDGVLTITDQTPKLVTTKDGAVYYDPASGATVTKAYSTQVRSSPYATAVGRCVVVHRSASNTDQLLAVKSSDANVTIADVPAPPVPKPLAAGLYEVK